MAATGPQVRLNQFITELGRAAADTGEGPELTPEAEAFYTLFALGSLAEALLRHCADVSDLTRLVGDYAIDAPREEKPRVRRAVVALSHVVALGEDIRRYWPELSALSMACGRMTDAPLEAPALSHPQPSEAV